MEKKQKIQNKNILMASFVEQQSAEENLLLAREMNVKITD